MASQRISGILSRKESAGDARAFLGVFGKHPGWNDHIDDIGLSTERLVQIKRVLYVEGIGGNIDAGAWDSIPESGRLPGFEHLFVWRWSGETAMGRFWSSRDGKGRTRYPMVACAQLRGQPVSWQVRYIAPMLERLEDEFKAADSAERVIALSENANREMEALTAGDPAPPDKNDQSATAFLAGHEAMGPDRRGMYRLLYQMERELSAFLRGGVTDGSRTRVADLTPRHLRVPRCVNDEAQSVLLWWRFVCEHVGDSAPVVLLSPRGAGFIDILVGESGVSQFTCVRAGEQTIPLTTEIPYSFDEEFIRRADARIAGAPVEVRAEGVRKIQQVGAGIGGAIEKVKAAGGARGMEPKQIAMIAGVAALGLVLVGGLLLLVSGGGKGAKTPGGSGQNNGGQSPGQNGTTGSGAANGGATGANFGPQQRADFAEWCASAEWALQMRDRLASADLSAIRADPHLGQHLVPLLEQMRSQDLVLDPRRVATGGARQLAALGSAPPASAQTDEGIARTAAALGVIRGLKSTIEPAAWPARATVERVAQMSRLAGWANLADALAGVSQRVSVESPGGLATLEAVVRTAGSASRLEAAWQRYEAAHRDVVEAQGTRRDERLAGLPGLLARVEAPVAVPPEGAPDAVAAAAGRLESVAAVAADVSRAIRDRWPSLDIPYFLASSPLDVPAGGVDEAYFRAWIQEVRRDAYSLLDPDDDPRRSWDVETRLASLSRDISTLEQAGGGIDPAEIDALKRELGVLREKFGLAAALAWDRAGQSSVLAAATELDRGVGTLEGGYDRLTGRLSEQWDRQTTRLRERNSVAGVTSPALQAAWRERRTALLAAFTTPDKTTVLGERVESLEKFLLGIEGAVPVPAIPRERPSVLDADALERAMAAERERTISALLASARWESEQYQEAGFADRAAAAGTELSTWFSRVAKAAADMARVEDLLDAGYGSGETGPEGATIAALVPAASSQAVGRDVAAVFAPLTAQVEALTRVEQEQDAAALARTAADAASPFGVALAAWRGLGDSEWPTTPVELRAEAELARALAARAGGLGDASRRSTLEREISAAKRTRWLACAGRVQAGSDAGALREVLAAREGFGVAVADLPPALRFCAIADAFGREAQAASATSDEAGLKRSAAAFLAEVASLGLPATSLASAAPWLDEIRALTADTPSAPVIDPTTLGPGTVGWRGEELDGGRRVRFTSADGSLTLEFVLVEPGDDTGVSEPVYLCTTELSIGALQWAAAQGDNFNRLKDLTQLSPPADGAGIKSWVFGARPGRDGVVPAEGWFLAGEVASGIQPWGQGLSPGRPGPKTPVTQIAPAAAAAVAEWLGCRLPTGAEWQGARQRYETGNDGAPPAWNLRDNTWGVQLRHVRSVQSGGRLGIKFPDEGVFHPTGSGAKTEGQAQTIGTDDGTLFFDDVDRPRGRSVLHLVGNVSEYVMSPGATPQYGVVGASALSAPEDYQALQTPCVIPVETLDFGWSDVGLRIAFGTKGEGGAVPLWRRMQRVGGSVPVLVGVAPGPR